MRDEGGRGPALDGPTQPAPGLAIIRGETPVPARRPPGERSVPGRGRRVRWRAEPALDRLRDPTTARLAAPAKRQGQHRGRDARPGNGHQDTRPEHMLQWPELGRSRGLINNEAHATGHLCHPECVRINPIVECSGLLPHRQPSAFGAAHPGTAFELRRPDSPRGGDMGFNLGGSPMDSLRKAACAPAADGRLVGLRQISLVVVELDPQEWGRFHFRPADPSLAPRL